MKGEKGDRGEAGPSTIKIGATELVDSSEPAEVLNEGSNRDVVLHFKIPKGKDGLQGIKGPKGDPGPATISVGSTKTGDAGTSAIVTNSGTTKDVILDFVIPKEADGEKIAIGTTYTLDANARAKVVDKLVENIHTIEFYITQGFDGISGDPGQKGEQGVQGNPGDANLSAYANSYENNANSYNLIADVTNQVELGVKGTSKNMDTSFTNAIAIKEEGVFKVDYFFVAKSSAAGVISLELRKDNATMVGTKISKTVTTNEYASFNGSTIVSLKKEKNWI